MFYSNLVILAPVRLKKKKILRAYPPPSLEASDSAMHPPLALLG